MAKFSDKEISELLHADALDTAEKITGKSYKDDEDTKWLGFGHHIRNSEAKRALMKSTNDSSFSEPLDSYLEIIQDIGFTLDYEEKFHSDSSNEDESFFVYWYDQLGILLHFDTYHKNVNAGNFHYCWRQNDDCNDWSITSSSSPCGDGIIAGYHDCREAIRFNIRRLYENGEFIKPWVKSMGLYLNHHCDKSLIDGSKKWPDKMKSWNEKSDERIAKLSKHIRKAIGAE